MQIDTVDKPDVGKSCYRTNRPPLAANRLVKLPLGNVKPRGWLAGMIERDRAFDVLSGCAGVIPVLLGLAAVSGKGLDTAHRCARHLLACAERTEPGLSWPPERQEQAARVLTEMEAQDESSLRLTDEQVAEVKRRLADPNPNTIPAEEVFRRFRAPRR